MFITIKKITALRLILALILMISFPAQTQAAWTDNLGNWLKTNLNPIAWAQTAGDVEAETLATINGTALVNISRPLVSVAEVYDTFVTGYSSSVDETDDTPFITASGETVRDGIVAANFLPLGTKIKIPEYFGNKIFVVKDRMARKHNEKVDIWFASKELAKQFGKRKLQVQVLEETI